MNFQEQLPAARLNLSLLTKNAVPMCRKPLHQEALTAELCSLCYSLCQQMDVLRSAFLSFDLVPKFRSP